MSTRDQLTEEERSILAFVQADFKKHGLHRALEIVQTPNIKLIELRTVIDSYRDRWQRQRPGNLKAIVPLKKPDLTEEKKTVPIKRYKKHPIYTLELPAGKRWRSIGMVFDPKNPAKEIIRLESRDVVSMTTDEAEEIAFALCKAWVDGLGIAPSKSN